MHRKRNHFLVSLQRLYITWESFLGNDLFTFASAGAYSFILSALPIVLMVLLILVRVLHTSPEAIQALISENGFDTGSIAISKYIEPITAFRTVGILEIIIGITVFWMARRFFASIQRGMRMIYRKQGRKKPIKENLIVIAGEVVLVILVVLLSIFLIAGNAFFKTVLSENLMTPVLFRLFRNLFRFVPFVMIFLFLFLVYFVTPSSRPRKTHSMQASAACTISFLVVQLAFSTFVNLSRYNLVYGILGNIIVIMLEVYLFFFLFLFFAQFQYVVQFFETFLLAQLYLLPPYDDPKILRQLERIMFIRPPVFYLRYAVTKKKGEIIYSMDDASTELYYVWNGTVRIMMPNQVADVSRGGVFGELSSIIGGNRTATAVALSDATLLKIPARLFRATIQIDGAMSRRALRMITDYIRKTNRMPLSIDFDV